MSSESKICQNCKSGFRIPPEDLGFYKKLDVDPPELCPECGLQLMMSLRNERTLYKRTCDKCKETILSMYLEDSEFTVFCSSCWWKDDWDGTDYAQDYNPNKSLLEQVYELQKKVPRESLVILNSPNCEYCNHIRDSRNCYLCALVSDKTENVFYSNYIVNCQDMGDCLKNSGSQRCYECIDVTNSYNCIFLENANDCSDCVFSSDLRGCNNCAFSVGLRNQSYHIWNKPYSKEEYQKEILKIMDGSYLSLQKHLEKFGEIKDKFVKKYANTTRTVDSTGDYLQNCNRAKWCFDGFESEDVRYVANILFAKNVYYGYAIGTQPVEWSYNVSVIKGGSKISNSYNLFDSTDCMYCDSLVSCGNCIGGVGMKRKNYCILNKQYTKEEFEKIRESLVKDGELKKPLTPLFSTFAFNESAAAHNYPLPKEEAEDRGYRWRDKLPLTTGSETKKIEEIPDNIRDITDEFLKEVLICEDCGRNYRVIHQELILYRQLSIPVPRRCPFCRMNNRYSKRTPKKLWKRNCMCGGTGSENKIYTNSRSHFHNEKHCPNEFETPYAPDRKEILYCEDCYNAEVA